MTSWFLSPSVRGGSTNEGRPSMIHGWFDLNGVTDPDTFSPLITGVQRLVTATPNIFFRVALDGPEPLSTGGVITLSAKPVNTLVANQVQAVDWTGLAVAAPALARGQNEIDIGVLPFDPLASVDTVGIRVYFTLSWYQ